ncbi:MAG: DUF4974 domain-containing protein [Bacteroidaceae bacterium]|nr:DUF4974 domain-containing protein [Bacteroidaceae bacterium]
MNTNEIPKAHPELLEALHRQDEKAQQMKLSQDFTEKVMEKVKSTPKKSSLFTLRSSLQKIAAISLAAVFLSGIAFAAWHVFSFRKEQPTVMSTPNSQHSALTSVPDSLVTFDGLRLDSILTIVGTHYSKVVRFRNEEARELRISTTWNRNQSLPEFLSILNEFDGLLLCTEHDTIFVETLAVEDEE